MKLGPGKLLGILEYLCKIKKVKESQKPSQAALKWGHLAQFPLEVWGSSLELPQDQE